MCVCEVQSNSEALWVLSRDDWVDAGETDGCIWGERAATEWR